MTATNRFRSKRAPGSTGVFGLMAEAKAAAAAAGKEASIDDPATYKYCLRGGTMPLLTAATEWYRRHYGVSLDPWTEALSLVGSQEGLAHLLMAVADPGEGVLMMDVGYACYLPALQIAGLRPVFLPHPPPGAGFVPVFSSVPPELPKGCRALLLNYPNNPTAATVGDGFWQEALEFCKRHDLLLINDNPYVAQVYGGSGLATSALAQPGARERCVELFSFAKSYQLGGFRLGFALGNADAIAALEAVKSPIDFNQYVGIQRMGIACLQLPLERLKSYASVFARRAEALSSALLATAHWPAPHLPPACTYGPPYPPASPTTPPFASHY